MNAADRAREELRLTRIADAHNLQTAADLLNFLEKDPKTCRDPQLRAAYMRDFQNAVPRLRS